MVWLGMCGSGCVVEDGGDAVGMGVGMRFGGMA